MNAYKETTLLNRTPWNQSSTPPAETAHDPTRACPNMPPFRDTLQPASDTAKEKTP